MKDTILAPVSPGELFDKLAILAIKSERIDDPNKLRNVAIEQQALTTAITDLSCPAMLEDARNRLKAVNEQLWEIEDDIRVCEAQQDFGDRFIALARAVYHTNDQRAAIKREINEAFGSSLIEEKSYEDY